MRFPDSRPAQHVAQWLRHTPMTEPGALASEFEKLPSDVASLNRIAQGLLVHSEWLSAYGLDAHTVRPVSRATLPVSDAPRRAVEAGQAEPARGARAGEQIGRHLSRLCSDALLVSSR